MSRRPTIGRIVLVQMDEDWKPAIVTDVHDERLGISVVVFDALGVEPTLQLRHIQHGIGDREWCWPMGDA